MEKDRVYLQHILDAIRKIQEYVGEMRYEDFLKNQLVQDGVVRQLEIIGEAVKNLSPDFREANPKVPIN